MKLERPDDCCASSDGAGMLCPLCGDLGLVVGASPVRAHRPAAAAGQWRYCPKPSCEIVFFLGDDAVNDREVICQVGAKAVTKPTPVCFCFAHTADDIRADVAIHDGSSVIMAEVKSAVTEGLCACEHLNPLRVCCLPAIHRAITDAGQPDRGHIAGA